MLRQHLASLTAILALTGSTLAQSVDLSEGPLVNNFFHVDLTMKLAGKTKVQQGEKPAESPLSADAHHEFVEKILHAKDGLVDKTVRIYRQAQATIKFGSSDQSSRAFRADRTLLVSQRVQGVNVTFCPHGSLTREEVELTEHFSTQAITGLLPGKEVKVGDSWAVPKAIAQTLCSLEGLESTDLTCKLLEVKDGLAMVQVKGRVNGLDLGVDVKIEVNARYQFDLKHKRLTLLSWKQIDEREQGPACPSLKAEVDIAVRREVAEPPAELGEVVLGGLLPQTKEPPADMTLISHSDPSRRFSIQYPREWIMTAQSRDHSVWRLMNRGDLVAQVTVTPWTKREAGKMMSFDAFVNAIDRTATWKEERAEEKNDKLQIEANRAYRYAAAGKLDGSDVVQYFYLLASPQGDHLFVTFTMSPNQVKVLNFRNESFVRGIAFPK